MGIGTIVKGKAILLMVSGERKADALARLMEGDIHEESPASILQQHPDETIIADEAALMKVKNKNLISVIERLLLYLTVAISILVEKGKILIFSI